MTFPPNWQEKPLPEVVTFNPRHERGLPDDLDVSFVPMPKISERSRHLSQHDSRKLGDVKRGYTHFRDGDVLFAKITPCMENGKAAIASNLTNGLGCGTTELHVLRPSDSVLPEWLYYYVWQERFRKEAERNMTGSAGQLRVPLSFLEEQAIPVPDSIDEQRQITNKLDHIAAHLGDTRTRLETIPSILKRFRMSVLAAACSGRLTEDWRRQNGIDRGWDWVAATEVCEKVQSGSTPDKGKFCDAPGVPFLKVYNIVRQQVDFNYKPQFITRDTHERGLKRSTTLPGDVLMNIVGPPLGKVAIVPSDYPEWNINQALTLFRPGPDIDRMFLYYVLYSGAPIADTLQETRGSAGQANISLSQCRALLLPRPSLDEQHEVVRKIEELFNQAAAIEARYRKAKTFTDKLMPAVLAKAFRGELIEQGGGEMRNG